jgi:hypothetical protein
MIRYQKTTASFMANSAIVLWIENREDLGQHCRDLRVLHVLREGTRNTDTINLMLGMSYAMKNGQLESGTVSVIVEGRDRKCAQSGSLLVRSRNHSKGHHRSIYTLVMKVTGKSVITMVPRQPSRDCRFSWQSLWRLTSSGTWRFICVVWWEFVDVLDGACCLHLPSQ